MCHPLLIRFEHVRDRFVLLRRRVETSLSERNECNFLLLVSLLPAQGGSVKPL